MTRRGAPESTALYTLKQVGEIIGVDLKTLHSWMRNEQIVPMLDSQDRRMRVLSEEQLDTLVEVAKRRKRRTAAPSASTPLGGNIRTVNRLVDEVRRLQETITAHGEAISRWEEMMSKVKASQIEIAAAESAKRVADMKQLEDRVDEALALFASAATRLESRMEAIEAMRRLEDKVDKSLTLFAEAAAKLETRMESAPEAAELQEQPESAAQQSSKTAPDKKSRGSHTVKRSRLEQPGKSGATSPLHSRDHLVR